jgi:hypothetical protein
MRGHDALDGGCDVAAGAGVATIVLQGRSKSDTQTPEVGRRQPERACEGCKFSLTSCLRSPQSPGICLGSRWRQESSPGPRCSRQA